jgi:hypothetical protein
MKILGELIRYWINTKRSRRLQAASTAHINGILLAATQADYPVFPSSSNHTQS